MPMSKCYYTDGFQYKTKMHLKTGNDCHVIVIAFSCLLKNEMDLTYKQVEKYH